MIDRFTDGSAGDADYGSIGAGYSRIRRPDARIAARIEVALGSAVTVLNVGAGAGSYEPLDREVTAVEPSASMRAQRPSSLPPAIDATAERLPFDDDSFDGSMASVTVHQWQNWAAGLAELRRVTRGPVVVLTFDPIARSHWWLHDYVPELSAVDSRRMPPIEGLIAALALPHDACRVEVETVMIPIDCSDGFAEAFFARPERLLDPHVRKAMSAWSFVSDEVISRFERELTADLRSGAWDAKYGRFRALAEFDGGLRLLVARPHSSESSDRAQRHFQDEGPAEPAR